MYIYAGVYLTVATAGKILKTVDHISPQTVYVHTPEQPTKCL